jgi:hypothetical protein
VNGTPVEARGFFPAIDDAAEDFVASSLTNRALAPSLLFVRNLPGGMTVSLVPSPDEIEIGIAGAPGAGEFAVIDAGFVGTQNLPAAPPPTITAAHGVPPLRPARQGHRLDDPVRRLRRLLRRRRRRPRPRREHRPGRRDRIYTTLTNQISAPIASIIVD